MKRLIVLVLAVFAGFLTSSPAQLLLSQGQSYEYSFFFPEFDPQYYFGDGHPRSNPSGFATFYSDSARSTPGATFTVALFESNTGESPIATMSGAGFVTAEAVNGWQDLQGVTRVTVDSGAVFLEELVINVYRPDGTGTYEQYSSGVVPVPEPGTVALGLLGAFGLLGVTLKHRRR